MIAVENLSKRYGAMAAVSGVSFRCSPGTVTGFVGPNGAGKSTTLRMICGLAEPSAGRATVLGTAYRAIPNPGCHVGVLLDASAQRGGRTGEETLTVAAMTLGVGYDRVAAVLDDVGLAGGASRKRVRTYSLGMRQRLLDAPVAARLRRPRRDGPAVLALLREVEKIADEPVVIGGGRIVARGAADELLVDGVDLEEVFVSLLTEGASR